MASNGSGLWSTRPAREYPIKRWLRERYGFDVPTWAISRYPVRPDAPGRAGQHPFPTPIWLDQQRR
jgi:hypothetical protein